MFQNPEIPLDELPAVEKLQWQPMHANFRTRLLVERLLVTAVLTVISLVPGLIFGRAFDPAVPLWVLVIIFAIPLLVWPFVAVPRRGYVVRDKDIVFRSGVVFRSVTAIPFNRIQHVETSNTPLDRKFGIATLQLFTAGGSGGDLKIHGLGTDIAEQLRAFLLDKVGASIENA